MTLRAIAWHRCCQGYFAGWPVLIENKLTDCTDATVCCWLAGWMLLQHFTIYFVSLDIFSVDKCLVILTWNKTSCIKYIKALLQNQIGVMDFICSKIIGQNSGRHFLSLSYLHSMFSMAMKYVYFHRVPVPMPWEQINNLQNTLQNITT